MGNPLCQGKTDTEGLDHGVLSVKQGANEKELRGGKEEETNITPKIPMKRPPNCCDLGSQQDFFSSGRASEETEQRDLDRPDIVR